MSGMTAALLTDLAVSEREKGASIDATCDIPREIVDPVSNQSSTTTHVEVPYSTVSK